MLVSLPAVALLAIGLLSALDRREVWDETLGPAIRDRVTAPAFTGIDFTVDRVFETGAASLILVASLLLLWELARAIRTATKALNVIFGCEERRGWKELLLVDLALSVALGVVVALVVTIVAVVPRLAGDSWSGLMTVAAWAVAAVLLGAAVALLVRYAPAKRPEARWATVGGTITVAGWIVASIAFGWWAGSVANYKSAAGALLVFLVLSAYVFTLCAIFLGGVQLDALAREESKKR